MKILLLGELSGLHSNLQDGFRALDHECTVIGDGDAWKNIPVQIDITPYFSGLLGYLERRIRLLRVLSIAKKFDVVQIIAPFLFKMRFFPTLWFFRKLKEQNGALFMLSCASDPIYWQIGAKKLSYTPFQDAIKYDFAKGETSIFASAEAMEFQLKVIDIVDGIIPANYDYRVSYEDFPKTRSMIPMPLNFNKVQYHPNIISGKIRVLHGLTRYGMKGTRHIEKAFEILEMRHPGTFDFTITGPVAFKDYMLILENCNILVDQTNCHSSGMNALYAMAMGKIVLGGAEPASFEHYQVQEMPLLNIRPSADSIVEVFELLLNKKDQFESLGLESRKFIETIHSHKRIASMYLSEWQK